MSNYATLSIITIFSTFFLSSCRVNWFGEQVDVEWWLIAIPVALLVIAVLMIGKITFSEKTYICPECKKTFRPKWWKALFAIHMNSDRVLKCPHCGRKGFCKVNNDD